MAEQRCSNVATKQHCSSPQHPANIEHAAPLAQSDPHPLRTLTSFAADLEALADKLLPKRRIFLAGASGGGPYALAAAARMRGRVRGVLLISPATHPGERRAPPPAAPQPCVRSARLGAWRSHQPAPERAWDAAGRLMRSSVWSYGRHRREGASAGCVCLCGSLPLG